MALRKDAETDRTQSQQLQKEVSYCISQYTYYVVNGPERIGSLCPALTASLPLSQLADLRSVVSQVGQPQSCLLQSLQQRQEELRAHRDRVTELEKELK